MSTFPRALENESEEEYYVEWAVTLSEDRRTCLKGHIWNKLKVTFWFLRMESKGQVLIQYNSA